MLIFSEDIVDISFSARWLAGSLTLMLMRICQHVLTGHYSDIQGFGIPMLMLMSWPSSLAKASFILMFMLLLMIMLVSLVRTGLLKLIRQFLFFYMSQNSDLYRYRSGSFQISLFYIRHSCQHWLQAGFIGSKCFFFCFVFASKVTRSNTWSRRRGASKRTGHNF